MMDANTPDPALLRAYPYFASNQLQQAHLQPTHHAPQLAPPLAPQHATQAVAPTTPSPDTNACEKLVHLARSIRARPVYEIQRIGGEDHLPLFRAYLLLTPQNYSTQGVGRSKMAARRDAAANMIKIINEKALGGLANIGDTAVQTLPSPPKVEVKEEPNHEMEEGELDSDDPDANRDDAALFFVDREPDPELEREANDERMLEEGSSTTGVPTTEEAQSQQLDYSGTEDQKIPRRETQSVLPKPQHDGAVAKIVSVENITHVETEPRQVPKRARTPPKPDSASIRSEPSTAEPVYAIPPRKRAKSIPREFPTRMRICIFCDYTKDVMNCLKALAEANLFVDLSITMFSSVELPKYVLLGKSVAAEVTLLPEAQRKSRAAVVATLAFAAGAKSEQVWVERAKHMANGFPVGISPRTLVLHDDPSLDVIKVENVIDVMRPTDDLVQHITRILERSKDESCPTT